MHFPLLQKASAGGALRETQTPLCGVPSPDSKPTLWMKTEPLLSSSGDLFFSSSVFCHFVLIPFANDSENAKVAVLSQSKCGQRQMNMYFLYFIISIKVQKTIERCRIRGY